MLPLANDETTLKLGVGTTKIVKSHSARRARKTLLAFILLLNSTARKAFNGFHSFPLSLILDDYLIF